MNKEEIKQYYERIEKLLNGANKETYGFAPEEIRQILKWYEVLQQENQQLKDRINKAIEYIKELDDNTDDIICYEIDKYRRSELLEILKGDSNEVHK